MFLKELRLNKEYSIVLLIIIYAYFINWFSGNVGVMPIDTFGFFDTGFSILKNKLPLRDFWIFTGLLVDYMESFFFMIFGKKWSTHVSHASFMNIVASLSFYFFLRKIKLNKNFSILYTLSFATLCYPVSGTPFAYLHSYIFSLIATFILFFGIQSKKNITWFLLPIFCFLAFLSMQTPSAYIILLILIFSVYYFLKEKNLDNIKCFFMGGITCILFFFIYLFITKTPFENFFYQYILFPLTIGEGRITSSEIAYVSLIDQLNFKRIFGDFKFIHFFLIPLIIITFRKFKKNNKNLNSLNLIIILSVIIFIFNQLMTANQIYIFSLIPLLAAIFHLNISHLKSSQKIIYIIIFFVLISTVKFHIRYNIDRKFHDLEAVNKINAIDASIIHNNLNGLKWITKFNKNSKDEINTVKKAVEIIKNDNRKKILITHYQFISTILDEDLNILNRWYLWDNNTHPTENHKYFEFYKNMVNKNIKENDVKVIYLLGQDKEILFRHVENYFTNLCFKNKIVEKNRFSVHEIINYKK